MYVNQSRNENTFFLSYNKVTGLPLKLKRLSKLLTSTLSEKILNFFYHNDFYNGEMTQNDHIVMIYQVSYYPKEFVKMF